MEITRPTFVPASNAGLTLVELLITLAIAAILIGLAVPSLRTLILDNRMGMQVDELFTTLQQARSLAISRQLHTLACPGSVQAGCSDTTHWENGWIVFADRDADQRLDADESPERVQNLPATGLSIITGSGRKRIVFQSDGSAGGSNTTFTFCDERGATLARAIILATTGRPRLSRTAADGSPLKCP